MHCHLAHHSCCHNPWWHHQMKNFSAFLAICAGKSPVTGEFPTQRRVTWSFDIFFDLRLNKWLSKQWQGWWFEMSLRSLWRHCNEWILCTLIPIMWFILSWGANILTLFSIMCSKNVNRNSCHTWHHAISCHNMCTHVKQMFFLPQEVHRCGASGSINYLLPSGNTP